MADIFISYSHTDKRRAFSLAEALVSSGFSVWWDKDLPAGDLYRRTIQAELDASRAVIVLWSEASRCSRWVLDEADFAAKNGKLIPVRIEDIEPPLGFRQHHTLDLIGWDGWVHHSLFTPIFESVKSSLARPSLNEVHVRKPPQQIAIAQSPLYVIRSITMCWGLEDALRHAGHYPTHTSCPWNDSILHDLDNGSIDVAIYNRVRTETYLRENTSARLTILRAAGNSMGGRHFSVLASRRSSWQRTTHSRFLRKLKRSRLGFKRTVVIGVPDKSDMQSSLILALGGTDSLHRYNIEFVDIPVTMGIEFFKLQPNGLLLTGQNVRLASLHTGQCVEVITSGDLPMELRRTLIRASANCMVVGERFRQLFSTTEMARLAANAWLRFIQSWSEERFFDALIDELIRGTFRWNFSENDMRNVARQILFESYRLGDPVE